ncbi:hypothetical protein NDU88_002976 [Pleurodeles waltl]|uniref:Uncharacterized protein n=1 Tax=Pleurodeles waltl TaxID=8319 RepID=A0AAV7RDK0_PLEWA|nr:hypothetical protein NDU88_002976 [Pleurodeles waltl]
MRQATPAPQAGLQHLAPRGAVQRQSPALPLPPGDHKQWAPVPSQECLAHRRAGPAPSSSQLAAGAPAHKAQCRTHPRLRAPFGLWSDPTADGPSHRGEQKPPGKSTHPRLQGAAGSATQHGAPSAKGVRTFSSRTARPGPLPRPGKHRSPPLTEACRRSQRGAAGLGSPHNQPASKNVAHPEK